MGCVYPTKPTKANEWQCLESSFSSQERPAVAADALGVAKYISEIPPVAVVSDELIKAILEEATGLDNAGSLWEKDGNLIVDMFGWLFEGITVDGQHEEGITSLIDDEFEMYRHYLRLVNGRPNWGWLRTMVFELTQQLVRQDLAYWMLYVALRPDRNHRLVSFPYYCKYVGEDDHNTAFRHIDISIPRYLESGRGGNMIQGSVSLDDETAEDGCTVLVAGFHHHIAEWWSRKKNRILLDILFSLIMAYLFLNMIGLRRMTIKGLQGIFCPSQCPQNISKTVDLDRDDISNSKSTSIIELANRSSND